LWPSRVPSAASADSLVMRLMWAGALVGVILAASTASAQREAPPDREILSPLEQMDGALRDIRARLEGLTAAIRGGPPSSPVETVEGRNIQISLRGAAAKGSPAARIAIVEYSDFECPFCGQHARTAYAELGRSFVETGRVKYVFRHLPLERLHPRAFDAAIAAECAGAEGRFWEMHDRLFAGQNKLGKPDLVSHAEALRLDAGQFERCLSSARAKGKVQDDLGEANRLGLVRTGVIPPQCARNSRGCSAERAMDTQKHVAREQNIRASY